MLGRAQAHLAATISSASSSGLVLLSVGDDLALAHDIDAVGDRHDLAACG
jgi:hypothetical protein